MENQQSYDIPVESSQLIKLFKDELKDSNRAEKAFIRLFPKLIKNAKSQDIIDKLKSRLAETKKQIRRMERFFESIEKK